MEMKIKVRPFMVPNFVLLETPPARRGDPWSSPSSIPLAEVPTETLEELCAEFRRAVFKKAGRACA